MVLGAGFSAPAGVPLAAELWTLVRHDVTVMYGSDNWVERDLARYLRYRKLTEGADIIASDVNLEQFLGFLDTEHYLGLKGKDNWSDEGNESQLMIRNSIARVLYSKTPSSAADIPSVYLRFAERLTTSDWVISFNYDLLLESALRAVGLPFRRFPHRYSEVGQHLSTIDDSRDELVLLKMHGSIDWFDRTHYTKLSHAAEATEQPLGPRHAVFGRGQLVHPIPLVDGPRAHDDPLAQVFAVDDIGPLLDEQFWLWTPLILAPSTAKLYHARPLLDFWWGANRSGGLNLGFGIVGYSLPHHDEYARQMLYHMTRNYTGYEPDFELSGVRKSMLRVLDWRPDRSGETILRSSYRFLEPARSEFWLEGLSQASVDWLFAPRSG